MKKIIISLVLLGCLQGCLPTVFVAGAAAGGAVIYDHRSTVTMVQDRDITYSAQEKVDNDPQLKGRADIDVATFNHIVLLVGQAPTKELRDRAEALVKTVPNIRMLYNEITIEPPTSESVRANDAWITSKVKTVLFAEPNLNSSQLKIVTENGVVYMMGLTTKSQATLAADKTRNVAGVTKVVKLFEYIS